MPLRVSLCTINSFIAFGPGSLWSPSPFLLIPQLTRLSDSRIQSAYTRYWPPSLYLLLYYFYFSVHASLRFFTSSSAHSFPFLLFISSSVPSPVRMIKSLTHSLTPSSVRRRLLHLLPPGPPLSIVESTLRRVKHCTLWPLYDGDYSSSGMCVGSFPFDV